MNEDTFALDQKDTGTKGGCGIKYLNETNIQQKIIRTKNGNRRNSGGCSRFLGGEKNNFLRKKSANKYNFDLTGRRG
jgi:hypothetical protein